MLCCAAWMSVAALAQVTSGSVSGYILDPSSKNIPGATVTIRDAAHSMERKTEADAIDEEPGCGGCERVDDREDREDHAVLFIAEVKLGFDGGSHGGEKLAVEVVESVGKNEDGDREPAKAGGAGMGFCGGGHGCTFEDWWIVS